VQAETFARTDVMPVLNSHSHPADNHHEAAPQKYRLAQTPMSRFSDSTSSDHHLSPSTTAKPDRRRWPRYTAQVQIELRRDDSDIPLRLQTTDLSRGGCYVQLMMTLPVGTYLNATLWLDDVAIFSRGRIVTRHPQFGNGIMFLNFQGNGEQLLARYLEAIAE
jgi:hypothetical protein